MSTQYLCPHCYGEFHAAEDHICSAKGDWMRGPLVELPSKPPAVGDAQASDVVSASD